jgi:hypothetical protein
MDILVAIIFLSGLSALIIPALTTPKPAPRRPDIEVVDVRFEPVTVLNKSHRWY